MGTNPSSQWQRITKKKEIFFFPFFSFGCGIGARNLNHRGRENWQREIGGGL